MNRPRCKKSNQTLYSGCESVGATIERGRALMRFYSLVFGGALPERTDHDDTVISEAIVDILMMAADDENRNIDEFIRTVLSSYQSTHDRFQEFVDDPDLSE
tara:strand:+ start:135 stop:440 length:306 start_codon:yes stop_codon:yes gene_type:complete